MSGGMGLDSAEAGGQLLALPPRRLTHEALANLATPTATLLGPVCGRVVTFSAYGLAQPQGSSKAFYVKQLGRAVVTSDNPRIKDWRRDVARAAGDAMKDVPLMRGAVELIVVFYRPRVKSWPRKRRFATGKPDSDKLLRAVGDALTGIVFQDDAQVVAALAFKAIGEPARADVCVRELGPEGV